MTKQNQLETGLIQDYIFCPYCNEKRLETLNRHHCGILDCPKCGEQYKIGPIDEEHLYVTKVL